MYMHTANEQLILVYEDSQESLGGQLTLNSRYNAEQRDNSTAGMRIAEDAGMKS